MRLGVLYSGGKDSNYALFKEKNNVVCLISVISKNKESFMFHTPNIHLVELQAEAIGLPLLQKITEGKKEEELEDLKAVIKEAKAKFKLDGIVTGAIESKYQADRIQKICDDLNLKCVNPLWHKDQVELLDELLKHKFEVIISGVFAYGLDKSLLGKELDRNMITKLVSLKEKYKINPAGEGGEIETTVLDAPFFNKRIEILESEINAKEDSGIFIIKKAKLAAK
jgi:diphthine-ammonia ligase